MPLVSKAIKESIHDQTQDYLQRNELLCIYQSGFMANHSTDSCVYRLIDMVLKGVGNGQHIGYDISRSTKGF